MLLSLIGIIATLWLTVTGQLGLYIHPRYFVFTAVMAVLAAVFTVAAFAIVPSADAELDDTEHDHAHDDHAHEPDHQPEEPGGKPPSGTAALVGSVLVIVLTAGALLALPPATLTTSTVEKRDLNASVAGPTAESIDLTGGDYSSFTVKDWAALIRQGASDDYFAGTPVTLTGFVTPDPDDAENVFYVARFVVTCCAVDAQPVGVAVYAPGWQDRFPVDSWVTVTGEFDANPSLASLQTTAITPVTIEETTQPNQPYVY